MTQNQSNAEATLAAHNAVVTGSHFVYTAGDHGSAYVDKNAIYPHVLDTMTLCKQMALLYLRARIDAVVGAAQGGITLSNWVTYWLQVHNTRHEVDEVLSLYAEKDGDALVLKRGYDKLVKGRRVLIVEDIINTGSTVRKLVQVVQDCGGVVHAVVALCNRGGITAEMIGAEELTSLVNVTMDHFPEVSCPLCAAGVPINTELGKGKEFLARQKPVIGGGSSSPIWT